MLRCHRINISSSARAYIRLHPQHSPIASSGDSIDYSSRDAIFVPRTLVQNSSVVSFTNVISSTSTSQEYTVDFRNTAISLSLFRFDAVKTDHKPVKRRVAVALSMYHGTFSVPDFAHRRTNEENGGRHVDKLVILTCVHYHMRYKGLLGAILGFNSFKSARATLSGLEPVHMIRKGQVRPVIDGIGI